MSVLLFALGLMAISTNCPRCLEPGQAIYRAGQAFVVMDRMFMNPWGSYYAGPQRTEYKCRKGHGYILTTWGNGRTRRSVR